MKTIRLTLHPEFPIYDNLFRVYSSCLRYAYNRYIDNGGVIDFKALYKDLYDKFQLNKRYIYDIISQANSLYHFHQSTRKKNGSDVCFGTSKSFSQYRNGELTKDELKAERNRMIWSVGEKYSGGNSNHCITKDKLGQYWIESNLLRSGGKKTRSYKSDKFQLFIPKEFRSEFDNLDKWTITILNTWVTKGYYEARLSYQEGVDYLNHPNIISFDLNHSTLDYSVVISKTLVSTSKITLNLSGKVTSKQKILVNIIKNKLIPLAFKYKAHFVIENLNYFNLSKNLVKSKKARRKINDIPRQMYMNLMVSIPKKLGIKTELVNPKYTSHIAIQKYSNEFKNKDQGASYVIGRKRVLGKKNYYTSTYDFYEKLPKSKKLLSLCIAILLNVRRLITGTTDKIKPKFTNHALWYYLYNIDSIKLKDSLGDVESINLCNGSIELIGLVLRQVESLVTQTESDKDFKILYEFLRKLSISLREIRRDYILNSSTGALIMSNHDNVTRSQINTDGSTGYKFNSQKAVRDQLSVSLVGNLRNY